MKFQKENRGEEIARKIIQENGLKLMDRNFKLWGQTEYPALGAEKETYKSHHFGISELWVQKLRVKNFHV